MARAQCLKGSALRNCLDQFHLEAIVADLFVASLREVGLSVPS
jgi:hypothetical protein